MAAPEFTDPDTNGVDVEFELADAMAESDCEQYAHCEISLPLGYGEACNKAGLYSCCKYCDWVDWDNLSHSQCQQVMSA